MELHHIVPSVDGGEDSAGNCIPLCFDCHAEVGHYCDGHPKGRKFTTDELITHRDQWYLKVESLNANPAPVPQVGHNIRGSRNIVAGRDVTITEKIVKRIEVLTDPGGRHITDAEALQLRQAVAKYSELMKSVGLNPNPSHIWSKLYRHFQVTSYKEIPSGGFDKAMKIINTEIGKARPKLRRRDPALWRTQYYTAIYAAANALSMSKDEVYRFAFEALSLKKAIGSLKELTQKQLQDLDRKMKARSAC